MSTSIRPAAASGLPDYTGHDDLLADLAAYGPSLGNGLINHAPMVVEALCALGRPARARTWFEAQRDGLAPRPLAAQDLKAADWRSALGQPDRFADLAALIRAELAACPWREVLDRWSARLAPGFATAACHGVIRTGHAARALAVAETPARLGELAEALASWAAMYETLPVRSDVADGVRKPRAVLMDLDGVPESRRPPPGLITTGLLSLSHAPAFAAQVGSASVRVADLDQLTALFAEVFCASARNGFTAIVFTHAVTGCGAVGNLQPHVGPGTAQALLERAWEAGCALQAAFGVTLPVTRPAPAAAGVEGLIDAAIANGDDHVIKLTEVCVGAFRRHHDPSLLAAAARVQQML